METSEQISFSQTSTNPTDVVQKQMKNFACELTAGFMGGATARLIGHPIDTVKVLLQTHDLCRQPIHASPHLLTVAATRAVGTPTAAIAVRSPSSVAFIASILRNNSGLGFFRGVTPPMLSDGIIGSVLFGVYKFTQKSLDPTMEDKSVMIFSSILAAAAAMVPSVPVEVIKVRLQMEAQKPFSQQKTTLRSCIRSIYKEGGLRGFYRGAFAQGLVDIPGTLVYFPIYDLSLTSMKKRKFLTEETRPLVCGGLAGLLSTLTVTPCDVLKTRIQGSPQLISLRSAVRDLRRQGMRSFFLGWQYNAFAYSVISATQFFVYERVIRRMDSD